MSNTPIYSTAERPMEFIPTVQDADKLQREGIETLNKRQQANDRRRAAALARTDWQEGEAKAEMAEIDGEDLSINHGREGLEIAVKEMRERYPHPQVFILAIPTSVERDQINSRLVQMGLTQVTQEQIRATMVEELFHEDWTGTGDATANELVAEEKANFLDSVWMRQEAHDAAVTAFQEQETERVLDEMNGAPHRPRAELPPKIITVRELAKMQLLIDHMMTTNPRMRDLAAKNMDFARRNAIIMARMHIVAVQNLDLPEGVSFDRDPRTRALSEETVAAIREAVDRITWIEVTGEIDKLYRLDAADVKNSDSPLGKPPPTAGSLAPIGDQAINGGSSTVSSSGPVLVAESGKTIDSSFVSSSETGTAPVPATESASPTAAP